MRLIKTILISLFLAGAPALGLCAQAEGLNHQAETQSREATEHEEGLTPHAVELAAPELPFIGRFPITNSMVVTWAVALGLIIFAQMATRQMRQIPSGAQNFWEWLVESLYNFLEGVIGHALVGKTFWFFAT